MVASSSRPNCWVNKTVPDILRTVYEPLGCRHFSAIQKGGLEEVCLC